MEFETPSMGFIVFHSKTHSFSLLHPKHIFHPCMAGMASRIRHLANTGSLSYRTFINTFQYKMSNNSHLLTSPLSSSETSLSIGELSSSQEWKQIFQNSDLRLIASVFSKAIYTVRCFPWSGRLTWFFLSDCLPATQLRVTHSCPVILSRKNCVEKGS